MSDATLLLARLLGPTLGIIALGMLINPTFYKKAYEGFLKESFAVVVTVMAMIPLGVAMVSSHFLWGSFAEGLISVLCLVTLIKAITLALFPTAFNKLIPYLLSNKLIYVVSILWLLIGGYLTWVGFWS